MRTPMGYRKSASLSTVKSLDDTTFTDGTNTGVPLTGGGPQVAMIQALDKNIRWRDDCTVAGEVTGVVTHGGLVQVTTSLAHGLVTNDTVGIQGVKGATGVNGTGLVITKISDTVFDVQGSTFGGTYTTGGIVLVGGVPSASVGMQLKAGETLIYDGPLHRFRLIEESATATVLVNYYKL
jgi:hypothetical protein